ncbi:response regulator transcription factor [Proteinivorax tanatarense]|uniref:Stage 0 sporulation protein A homolog n=1 Tax=Proteinivorax tanatarense TaxID=1260629 RepID=A0AAU7VPU0_9FIRM
MCYLKVLIVDDDGLIRDSLKMILDLEEDIEVIATAKNGKESIDLALKLCPDVILMDIRMPEMDGVEATKVIKDKYQHAKILILTTFKEQSYIAKAIKSGANGYILKSQRSEDIVDAVRSIYKGGNSILDSDVIDNLKGMLKEEKSDFTLDQNLSHREIEILELVAEGLSNKEIADILHLSPGTVRNYITSLLDKLSLRDRTQLAIYYLKN